MDRETQEDGLHDFEGWALPQYAVYKPEMQENQSVIQPMPAALITRKPMERLWGWGQKLENISMGWDWCEASPEVSKLDLKSKNRK